MSEPHDPIDDLRRIDPVDGERIAATWADSDAKTALFQEITTMPVDTVTPLRTPVPPRRPRYRFAIAAGLVVAAAAIAIGGGTVFNGSPAYAIRQLDNGVIEIDWFADHRDGSELAAELRQFGIEVDIVAVPASPSAVGTITGIVPGEGTSVPEGITWGEDGTDEVFTWQIDPAVFRGPISLDIAVAAEEGEPYQMAEEVFEPGEVLGGLHCALGEPLRAADVAKKLPALGVEPVWNVAAPVSGDPGAMRETTVDEVPAGEILWGYAVDDATVNFTVVPDGVSLDPDFYPTRLSDLPCTPGQAAAWD